MFNKIIIGFLSIALILACSAQKAQGSVIDSGDKFVDITKEVMLEVERSLNEADAEEAPETIIVNVNEEEQEPEPQVEISDSDSELLLRIAMAEAEGEDTEGKALVICVVLNRVDSASFPGNVHDVIYQKNQFAPVSNKRFDSVVPDSDCHAALEMVKNGWNESQGALYFESQGATSWHRKNLQFLFQHGNHYFYK